MVLSKPLEYGAIESWMKFDPLNDAASRTSNLLAGNIVRQFWKKDIILLKQMLMQKLSLETGLV